MSLTKEQVFAACDAIFAEGKKVSNEAVRSRLGSGSFSTISKLIREWKENQGNDAVMPSEPITIPADILPLFERVYAVAVASAQTQEDSDRVCILEAENQKLRADVAELDGLRTAYQKMMDRVIALSGENAKWQAEIKIQELGGAEALQVQLDEARVALSTAQGQIKSLTEQMNAKDERLTMVQNSLESTEATSKQLAEENRQLRIQNGQIENLQQQLASAKAAIAYLEKQAGSRGNQMTVINGELFYVDPLLAEAIATERQLLQAEIDQLKGGESA